MSGWLEQKIESTLKHGGTVWRCGGNTIDHRHHLKDLGWQWLSDHQIWIHLGGTRDDTAIKSAMVVGELQVEEILEW